MNALSAGSCGVIPQKYGAPDSFQFDWRLAVSSLIAFIGGAMSASVGVGGGGVYVPVLLLIACFDPKGAIPVSKVCILGVSVTTFIINARKRHPEADRPLINYSVAFLMAPTTILGTVFGIMLFIVFPQWFVLILLVIVLGITDYRTFAKAVEMHRKEEAEKKSLISTLAHPDEDATTSLLHGYEAVNSDLPIGVSNLSRNDFLGPDASALLDLESRTPIHKIMALLFFWLCMFLLVYIRGGGESNSLTSPFGIHKCSWQFWLLTVAIILVLCSGAAAGTWMQLRRTRQLQAAGIPKISGDIEWTPLKFIGFVSVGCFAGTCAGFLGIGSGMINVPYMLEVGMRPEVAAATSSFIIIFTAMSTVFQYAIIGALPLKSAAWYGSLGLLSAIVGQFGVAALVKKYKKSSIISFMLGALITVSAIGLIIDGVISMVHNAKSAHPQWGFHPYCGIEKNPKTTSLAIDEMYTPWRRDRWEL